jgi:DNA-binding NarL/FixJ family response regulator
VPSVALSRFEDLVAYGLRALIAEDDHLSLVAWDVPADALEKVFADEAPDVAILNYGSLAAPSVIRDLHRDFPATHLVVLANRPSGVEAAQLISFGAAAALAKDAQARDVLNAVHLASRGMQVLPRGQADSSDLLTPREADILTLLRSGRTNAQIAAALHVGTETVRTHARNIYRKLGVASRREL